MAADYRQRARAAHAAAEAATDPRDKAAYRAAARTWERLANPTAESAFSLQPYVRQLEALKRDIRDAIDAPASAPAVQEVVTASAHGMARVVDKRIAVAIEF
jgi:hypothetical protein